MMAEIWKLLFNAVYLMTHGFCLIDFIPLLKSCVLREHSLSCSPLSSPTLFLTRVVNYAGKNFPLTSFMCSNLFSVEQTPPVCSAFWFCPHITLPSICVPGSTSLHSWTRFWFSCGVVLIEKWILLWLFCIKLPALFLILSQMLF